MQASVMRIDEFISDKRTLIIPVYQRNYDWERRNCERLFDDAKHLAEHGGEHFIGTFVYRHQPTAGIFQEFVIIDGQQRITSIVLFARALYEVADADLKEDLHATFLKHSKGELKGKCKLRPTEYDREIFEKLMREDAFDENNFTAQEKISAMYRNYLFFREKISESLLDVRRFHDAIYQFKVVSILLQDENPQEIFESLNSTGLDLTQADLIRNFLLMPPEYSRQEELYKKFWLELEKILRPSGNVEKFIVQYLVVKFKSNDAYNKKVNPKTLYELFKRHFNDNRLDAETCLKDMLRYAKFFRRFIFDDETKFDNLPALDKKFFEAVYLLDAANVPIILMYLLDRHEKNSLDEATFMKFVDALISLTFRAKVCRYTGITQQFAGNVLARLDKESSLDEKTFWNVVTFGKGRFSFPRDKDFQSALTSEKLYETIKSHGCKYLLYSLERRACAKELPAYSAATVEHVMPQKLNAAWKNYLSSRNDLSTHEIFLHTLGNLTLTGYNPELGNSDFDAKKEIYRRSNFFHTRTLADYSEWSSAQIQSRAKKLASAAIKVWTLPEEFNSKLANVDDILTLDTDFAALKGERPATLFIFGKELKMPYWSHLLREIVRQLYALDKDIFRRATLRENVRQSLFPTEPTDFKIDEDFYMATGFDTETCLKTAKVLVENFDGLGGTNCKDEIWFTLKRG